MTDSLWNPRDNRRRTLVGIAAVLIGIAGAAALSRLVSRPEAGMSSAPVNLPG